MLEDPLRQAWVTATTGSAREGGGAGAVIRQQMQSEGFSLHFGESRAVQMDRLQALDPQAHFENGSGTEAGGVANAIDTSESRLRNHVTRWAFIAMLWIPVRFGLACWLAFSLTDRTFPYIPFAFDASMNILSPDTTFSRSLSHFPSLTWPNCCPSFGLRVIVLAVGSRLWARNNSPLSLLVVLPSVLWLVILGPALQISLIVVGSKLVSGVFFEPGPLGQINAGNAAIYGTMVAYVVLTGSILFC